MEWLPGIYTIPFIIAAAAGLVQGRYALVGVMLFNLVGTLVMRGTPLTVGVIDLMCACSLVAIGGKRAYAISAIFLTMLPLYYFADTIGHVTTYTIVDVLAYTQLMVLGGGGFGKLIGISGGLLRSGRSIARRPYLLWSKSEESVKLDVRLDKEA
jgi:hypothetical protein